MSKLYIACGCTALLYIGTTTTNKFQTWFGRNCFRRLAPSSTGEPSPIEISAKRTELIHQVLKKSDPSIMKARIEFYLNNLPVFIHKGTTKGQTGASVGIPLWDDFAALEYLEKKLDTTLDLKQKVVADYVDSFDVSDECFQFGIAQQICYLDSYQLYINSCLKLVCFGIPFAASYPIRTLPFRGQPLPLASRFILYGIAFSIGWFVYALGTDAYQCRLDATVDQRAARLDPSYALGGVEFYEKELLRNQSRRQLDKSVEKYFTNSGNLKDGNWRQKSLCLSTRLKKLQEYAGNVDTYGHAH